MRIPIYYVAKKTTIEGEDHYKKVFAHCRRIKCDEYINALPEEERAMCYIGSIYRSF